MLDHKLAAVRSFGATHTLNPKAQDLIAKVRALTGGRGADYAFIAVASPAALAQCVAYVRRGGTIVAVGMPSAGATAALNVGDFVYNGHKLLGSNIGSARPGVDIPQLAGLYRAGRLKLDELITRRYPFEQINAAIESMERGEALRNVIVFNHE